VLKWSTFSIVTISALIRNEPRKPDRQSPRDALNSGSAALFALFSRPGLRPSRTPACACICSAMKPSRFMTEQMMTAILLENAAVANRCG